MELYTSEEQQVQAIKDWWAQYGRLVITTAVIGVSGYFGWNFYQSEQQKHNQELGHAYSQMQETAQNTEQNNQDVYTQFASENSGTIYAEMATLNAAAQAVLANDYTTAQTLLSEALNSADSPEVSSIIGMRLARVELQLGETDQALKTLERVQGKSEAYAADIEEIRGDIYQAQNNPEAAREAYLAASNATSAQDNIPLQFKLNDLSISPDSPAEISDDETQK